MDYTKSETKTKKTPLTLLKTREITKRFKRRSGVAGSSARVWHRRVVQVDAHLAVVVALVAEGVLHADLVAGGRVGEDIVAHRLGSRAVEVNLVVAEDNLLPTPATVDGKAGVLALELVIIHRLCAHEVRHRVLGRRAEGMSGRLCRLEEYVAVAVAVELACRLASSSDVVALVGIHLGDFYDRVGPQLLRRLRLIQRDGRRTRGRVWHRRMVQVDALLAVVVALVAEGVLHADLVASGRVGEDAVAHRLGSRAVEVNLVVAEDNLLPATATVDGKAGVLALEFIIVHRLGAHEVRHRVLGRRAEGVSGRLCRLEENITVAVAVELARGLASSGDVVALVGIHLGDLYDRVGPQLL